MDALFTDLSVKQMLKASNLIRAWMDFANGVIIYKTLSLCELG